MSNYKGYLELMELDYQSACKALLEKYGAVPDDYFTEDSYRKLLNGTRKTATKGKTSGTARGLYVHHIDEDKYLNMTNFKYIVDQQVPYETQKADRLLYCDLVEHTILHALLAVESKGKFGLPGYMTYLADNVLEWYSHGLVPAQGWRLTCYNKSILSKDEADHIITTLDKRLLDHVIVGKI